MTGGLPPSESERRAAAAAWLVWLQSDASSEGDWLKFEAWLGDPANKATLDAMEVDLGAFEDHADQIATALQRRATRPQPRETTRRSKWKWVAAGGGLLLAAAAAFAVLPRPTMPTPTALMPASTNVAFNAPADAVLLVALADGSKVRLNRGAAIEVRWSSSERRVTLTHGEAAFVVKHDSVRPFVVAAGEAAVRDLGTEFNVLRRTDNLTVTVRQGAVEVSSPGVDPVPVAAGGELRLDTVSHQATLSKPNADDAFAWQEGRLVYHDATLAAIVDDLNQYGSTPIRLADPAVAGLRFSGVLMIKTPSEMVLQLQAFLPVRSEPGNGEIRLKGR